MSQFLFKIAICGATGVGKTSLFNRFISNTFRLDQLRTIGINFAIYSLKVPKGEVNLHIWDYGGDKSFRSYIEKFLEGTSGAFLTFDLTCYSSFIEVEDWHILIEKKLRKKIPMLLVGCKGDICEQDPITLAVPNNEIEKYMQKHDFIDYVKTSAKTGNNVRACFELIASDLIRESHNKNNTRI